MTAGIRSSTRSKAIPRLAIEQAESFLQELPKKEKEHLPISEAISGISDTVRAALAKGYSYNEISDMLSDKLGISVSAWSLRRYIPAGSRRGKRSAVADAEAAPKRRKRKTDSAADSLNGSAAQAISAPEVAPVSVGAPIIETPAAEPATTTTRRATTRGKSSTTKAEAEAKPAAKTRTTRSQTAAAKKTSAARTKTGTRTTRSRKQKG